MIKEWLIAKALAEAFKVGIKSTLAEDTAVTLENYLDKLVRERTSEEIQDDFEEFMEIFTLRLVNKLREDRHVN